MYVDDVSTLEMFRGNGFADKLMEWVIGEAQLRQCEEVHLDSGVGSDRASAHRLYMRNHRCRGPFRLGSFAETTVLESL